jgi:hypothetical protein
MPVAVAPPSLTPSEQTNWACAVSMLPLHVSPAMAKATEKNDTPIRRLICISCSLLTHFLRASIAIGFPSMGWIRVLAELNGRREDPTAFLNGKTQTDFG